MKSFLLVTFFILPIYFFGQKMVFLTINQPPKFGFSISKQDTTINKGASLQLGADVVVFGGSGEYRYHWSPTATLSDSNILKPIAKPLETTIYTLTIADRYGCNLFLNYKVNVINLSGNIDLNPKKSSIQAIIFPNPNQGSFKLHLTGSPAKKLVVEIFNIQGKILTRKIIRDFTGDHITAIQMRQMDGSYVVRINTGNDIISREFTIQ